MHLGQKYKYYTSAIRNRTWQQTPWSELATGSNYSWLDENEKLRIKEYRYGKMTNGHECRSNRRIESE